MKITVQLEENPSTGYKWESTPSAEYSTWSSSAELDWEGGIRCGAGGTRTMRFNTGQESIRLELRRPWLPDEPPIESYLITRGDT